MITWGMADSRKMLTVLPREFQNSRLVSSAAKLSNPTQSPGPLSRSQSFSDTTKVYARGNSPTSAKSRKNGEM